MISKTNIESRLGQNRDRRISPQDLLKEVAATLEAHETERNKIKNVLTQVENKESSTNEFRFEALEAERIFHIRDIQSTCVTYRLRFLDAHFFKGEFPEEAVSRIQNLERTHETKVSGFKIMAPAKLLKLENADDPLLFAPMGNDYYYLIYKWGNDLHPLRKWLMWPFKNFENLIFTIFVTSILLTAMTPMQAFTKSEVTQTEYLLMFLFMFKAVAGIVLFIGFAKGKNFNEVIWNSKYYNA